MNLTTDDLRDVLAEQASRQPANLRREGEIRGRIIRRRRRLAGSVLAAAATVAALALAAPYLGPAATRDPASRSGEPPALPSPTPVSVAVVAPQAVHALPERLPNGKRYLPRVFADDHTMIVASATGPGFGHVHGVPDIGNRPDPS